MITLTIKNLKTQAQHIEVFSSKDEAEKRLTTLKTDPADAKTLKNGDYLVGWSFDSKSEKELIEANVVETRRVRGKD